MQDKHRIKGRFSLLTAGDTDGGGQGSENGHDDVDDGFPGFFLHS